MTIDVLLRNVVSNRAGGRCEFPGCNKTECDPHHIFGRANKAVRFMPQNCVWLCSEHHRCAHQHRHDFIEMMITKRGINWFTALCDRKNQIVKYNKAFLHDCRARLENELRGMAA